MLYILIALCAVLAGVFLYTEIIERYVLAVILKGMASLCFVLIGVLHNPGGEVATRLMWGLILGCVADVLLNLRFVFKKRGQLVFLVGILVFLAGHIMYLAAILKLSSNWKICFAIGFALTVILILWMYRQITAKPAFKIFGVIYLGTIMLLNAVAIGNLIADLTLFNAVFALGAFLFLVSDIVLIFNTFGKNFRQSFRISNIVLYYAGQILIAISLMLLTVGS